MLPSVVRPANRFVAWKALFGARQANPDMDIVMMHFACTEKLENFANGKTPEVIQSFDKVAAHYGVPTLDITEEIY